MITLVHQLCLGEHNGVDITPLSYIPGKRIEQYLGDLDFFFIRESSSIREVIFIFAKFISYYLCLTVSIVLNALNCLLKIIQ